jgi:alpha-mannosidase
VSVDLSPPGLARALQKDFVQVSQDGKTGYILADHTGAGFAPVSGLFATSGGAQALKTSKNDFVLKNSNIEFKISGGRIVSLYDVKLDRELVPEGKTGGFVIFTDR